jgi:hypothetical protein
MVASAAAPNFLANTMVSGMVSELTVPPFSCFGGLFIAEKIEDDGVGSSSSSNSCSSNRSKKIIMADHAAGDDIFVYTGGIAPLHVVNVIIDESVEEIDDEAFRNNRNLRSVVCHAGLLKVGKFAFHNCSSLQRVKMPGVKNIEVRAFSCCNSLVDVEFDK